MAIAVAAERVRRDVEVLSRAGLDIETYLAEVEDSMRRALPFVAACVATCDPVTGLLTGTYKFGDLYGRDERDQDWGTLEYGNPEPTSFIEMAAGDQEAAAVSIATGGDVERSPRMRDF